MIELPSDLGARIRLATQMAVTAHWQAVLTTPARVTDDTPAPGPGTPVPPDHQRQRDGVGGTNPTQVTEDQLPSRRKAARRFILRAARRRSGP